MRMVDIIHKKREGQNLTKEEIGFFINGYTDNNIPDYQVSSLLMAIYFNGMHEDELSHLVSFMVESGDTIDLSPIEGIKVDKHSTGGVGDKTSLIVTPLVATVGVPVAKMSGRGLGHTGGTIDKLEAIKGFRVELSQKEFIDNVNKHKIALAGQSGNLVPADKLLYSLRDVTDTVDSIPLIASSIMSKKVASGADAIVLDVKTGTGAFMKTEEDARTLARTMVNIGNKLNRKTVALISDMNQPLGHEIGNANEIREVIETLQGKGPEDLKELSLVLAAHMAVLGGAFGQYDEAYRALEQNLNDGSAFDKFKEFVEAQGGCLESIFDIDSRVHIDVKAKNPGYLSEVNSELIGTAAMLLGAGRQKKGDDIDHSVGLTMHKKLGEKLSVDDTLFTLHSNQEEVNDVIKLLNRSYKVSENPVAKQRLIYDVIK